MGIEVTNEKGHFLNEKQKEVKQQIMQDLMNALYGNLEKNSSLFMHHPQETSDLIFSILIMFSRDLIVHLLQTFGLQHNRKDVLKHYCDALKDEVNAKIKKGLM